MSTSLDEKETGRVEAFSDGVFAIAITLLVLELKVPVAVGEARLAAALAEDWPSYLALLTSFATIGIMWLNHHMVFTHIRRVDRGLLVLNALLLLGVTVVPFPTALLARYLGHDGERLASLVYSGTFVYIAIVFTLLWRYAASHARKLLRVAPDSPEILAVTAQYRFGPLFYLGTMVLSALSASAALAVNLAFALYFALPPEWLARRRG